MPIRICTLAAMTTNPEASRAGYTGPVAGGPIPTEGPTMSTRVNRTAEATRVGITMGTALAITISWSANHSILWAIIHGFLSWLYVIYYAIRY